MLPAAQEEKSKGFLGSLLGWLGRASGLLAPVAEKETRVQAHQVFGQKPEGLHRFHDGGIGAAPMLGGLVQSRACRHGVLGDKGGSLRWRAGVPS